MLICVDMWCMFGENYCYCFVKERLVLHSFKWCSAKSHEWMKFCTYEILCATLQLSDISIPAIMNEQPHKWWCLSSFCRHSRNLHSWKRKWCCSRSEVIVAVQFASICLVYSLPFCYLKSCSDIRVFILCLPALGINSSLFFFSRSIATVQWIPEWIWDYTDYIYLFCEIFSTSQLKWFFHNISLW